MVCREAMVVGELVVDACSYGAVASRVCVRQGLFPKGMRGSI